MPPAADPSTRRPRRPYGGVSADRRVAERRERLLAAAREEFGTRGVHAVGVKDVCRRAGLTDRYFYESFRDSGELFLAVFDRVTSELYDLVAAAVAAAPPEPEPQARAAVGSYVAALAEDPAAARIVFLESAAAGPAAERHMRATLRRFAALIAETSRPHLPAGIPERAVALGSMSLVGAVERLVIEWQDGALDASVEQITDHLVAMALAVGMLAGVGAAPRTTSTHTKGERPLR